jgi:hypothetical protein
LTAGPPVDQTRFARRAGRKAIGWSAKFFPLQHGVDAIQDDKGEQTQMNKPQAATASAAPAKLSSGPRED